MQLRKRDELFKITWLVTNTLCVRHFPLESMFAGCSISNHLKQVRVSQRVEKWFWVTEKQDCFVETSLSRVTPTLTACNSHSNLRHSCERGLFLFVRFWSDGACVIWWWCARVWTNMLWCSTWNLSKIDFYILLKRKNSHVHPRVRIPGKAASHMCCAADRHARAFPLKTTAPHVTTISWTLRVSDSKCFQQRGETWCLMQSCNSHVTL